MKCLASIENIEFGTFTLAYDAKNRLVSATGAATASFTYDGDGKQVKSIVGGVTTYYVGQHYEKKGTTVTKYYFAGATRLAVRTGGTLSYLLGDHLSSSSVTTSASGVKTASALYKAFGETRFSSGALGTDYKFTGQREQAELGLYFYGARWYDSSLGRFTSPDTMIPSTQGVQAWDRYAYVNNNPVRYKDPSGHKTCDGAGLDGECDQSGIPGTMGQVKAALNSYGVKLKSRGSAIWTFNDAYSAYLGVSNVALALAYASGREAVDIFRRVYGPLSFILDTDGSGLWSCASTGNVTCTNAVGRITGGLIAHELGHEFRRRLLSHGIDAYVVLGGDTILDADGNYVSGVHNGEWDRDFAGYRGGYAPYVYHGREFDDWNSVNEDFADMFMNWVYGSFSDDPAGLARNTWMVDYMQAWTAIIP